MVNPVVAVEEQVLVLSQTSYDVIEAFASTDACALMEPISFEGGNPEWHPSTELVGNSSLQTEIRGKRQGTWSAKAYAKTNTLGSLPDAHEMMRAGMGRQQVVLTVLDYTAATTDTVTLTVGGAATVLTEGTDFNAVTSNNLTASNLSSAINNNATLTAAGVTAVASGATVTVSIITDWLTIASGDAAAITITSLRFALSSAGVPAGLQIMKYAGRSFCEVVSGAWVETIEIETEGNSEGTWSFSGGFARKCYLYGEPQTNTAGYGTGDTVITLAAGDSGKISEGVYVRFRRVSDGQVIDNSGAGYLVSSVDLSGGTITLASVLGSALSAAAWDIEPFMPGYSISGTILPGIDNGFTIAGTAVEMNSTKITVNTGVKASNKEATSDRPTRLARGKPQDRVMAEASFYFLDENTANIGNGWNGTTQAVVHRQGTDTTGQRATHTFAAARLHVPTVETATDEEAEYTATLIPRQSVAADDEYVITLD